MEPLFFSAWFIHPPEAAPTHPAHTMVSYTRAEPQKCGIILG